MTIDNMRIKETHVTIEKLVECVQDHSYPKNIDLVMRAYHFAQDHYAYIKHPTGISYIQYVLNVAKLLVDFGSAPIVICATLIFPPLPLAKTILDDLRKAFKDQNELVNLVEEILRLGNLEWNIWTASLEEIEVSERREILRKMFLLAIDSAKFENEERSSLAAIHFQKKEKQVENMIRMFLAEVNDIRAIVIKLFDRLHLIQILKYLTQNQQESIHSIFLAKTTLAIYAPLADRLGLWQLKSDLEDMSFRLLDMDKYKQIARYLALKKKEREDYISHVIIPAFEKTLKEYGIEAMIHGRAKHIYSIYKKMEAKQLTFEEINDLLGVRIIVDTVEDCYLVQDIIHEYWLPVTEVYNGERGRDWIAHPKENGYQSLHTTILIDNKMLEVQIRTHEMHEIAEYGAAAVHWRYKIDKIYRKGKTPRVTKTKDRIWNELLSEVRKQLVSIDDFADPARRDFFKYWAFVITPMGHVLGFPSGATPLDFAYRVHTSLGHMYAGAKVNGRIVRLDYTLKNGDIVEVLMSRTRKGPSVEWLSKSRVDDAFKKDDTFELIISRAREGPSPEWLSKDIAGYSYYVSARTRRARNKIRIWFNKQKLIA